MRFPFSASVFMFFFLPVLLLTAEIRSAHSVFPWGGRRLPSFIASLLHRPCRRNSRPTIPRAPPPPPPPPPRKPRPPPPGAPPPPPHAQDSSCWGFWRRKTFSRLLESERCPSPAPPVCHDVHCCQITAGPRCQEWRKIGQGGHRWVKRGVREHKKGINAHLRPVEPVARPNRGGGGGQGGNDASCCSVRSGFILTAAVPPSA